MFLRKLRITLKRDNRSKQLAYVLAPTFHFMEVFDVTTKTSPPIQSLSSQGELSDSLKALLNLNEGSEMLRDLNVMIVRGF